ncbi:hypothetical protein [Sphingomonas bacterium]|uniref:hypothetical protein n=1 Tax=Sphingomonas bacterium TaxID=1895847 RepID=UPI001576261A|nr:hypothetical protein [Sphingomonas bacterium]
MSDVDDAIAKARASWSRISEGHDGPAVPRPRRGQGRAIERRLTRIAAADAAILIAAFVVGLVMPIGIMGAVLVMAALLAATLLLAVWPQGRAPPPERLRTVDIRALPAQTERWLDAQRPALPAPARTLVDRIGTRLDALSPQLARVDGDTEDALELRRLIGEQLPAFVADYARVPATLRQVERNGRTPDGELVDGLKLIEHEIGQMTQRLAEHDLDSLSTRGRFLEMKYQDDGEVGGGTK